MRHLQKIVCAVVLVATVLPAFADTKPVPVPPKGPSVFVQCDGSPNKASVLGTAARIVAITAVIGLLLPEGEAPDVTKRLKGKDGINACNEALDGAKPASDGGRRIELILARAIHHIEAGEFDAAIADAHFAGKDQPALAETQAYKQSLGLTALEIEAKALVGLGNLGDASAKGQEMANAAPYDVINMIHALQFVRLVKSYDMAKGVFYDQLVRMRPNSLSDRARARDLAGDFLGAADDYFAQAKLHKSVPEFPAQFFLSQAAVEYRLAGKIDHAEALIKEARDNNEADRTAGTNAATTTATSEVLDLYIVLTTNAKGDAARARILFAGRSDWVWPSTGAVAETSRILRSAATPQDIAAIPFPDPDAIWSNFLTRAVRVIADGGKDGIDRYQSFRDAFSATQFGSFANNVWKTDKSRYFSKEDSKDYKARLIDTERNGTGMPSAYALFLHTALVAKAQGKQGFTLLPSQKYVYSTYVRIGNPGDDGIIAPILFNADKVIADLSPLIPQPVKK